jgi:hypothetical protein
MLHTVLLQKVGHSGVGVAAALHRVDACDIDRTCAFHSSRIVEAVIRRAGGRIE